MEPDQSGNTWSSSVATKKKGQMKIQEMAQDLPKFECLAEYIFKRRHLRDFHSPETSGVVGLIRFHDCSRVGGINQGSGILVS